MAQKLDVKVPYFLVAELAPLMAKRGKGAIVNVSTMAADYAAAGMSLYGSSKAAINLLTKTWVAEYKAIFAAQMDAYTRGPLHSFEWMCICPVRAVSSMI